MRTATEKDQDQCQTQRQVAEQFAIAARLYYEAVVRLAQAQKVNTAGLLETVVETQHNAQELQNTFNTHVKSHGC